MKKSEIENLVKQVISLQETAKKRAIDLQIIDQFRIFCFVENTIKILTKAEDHFMNGYDTESVKFNFEFDNEIEVTFPSKYDFGDYKCSYIEYELLELSEEEWSKYIETKTQEQIEANKQKLEKERIAKLNSKLDLLNQLQKEIKQLEQSS